MTQGKAESVVEEDRLQEAQAAREHAEQQLAEAKALAPQIRALVRADRQMRQRNHFAEIVYDAFRGV